MFKDKEYVYTVWKERSFSKAASRLYISQPSLSAKIKKIEEELGASIFDRSTSPLRLTEFGQIYIDAISEVRQIERRIENSVNDMNMLHSGELSIGASNVFAAYVLPPLIAKFKRKYPHVKIQLIEDNTASLERMLSGNEIDIVVDNNHYDRELFDRKEYTEERILLAVPSDVEVCKETARYELSERDIFQRQYLGDSFPAVPLSLFKDIPFILLTPNNDTRTRGEKMCKDAGFRPNIVLEVHQQATAYMIATTKMGATFVSDTLVQKMPSHANLKYYKLDSELSKRKVYFTLKKHKHQTKAMEEFMRMI
ncbi:MAG: LysR family transcriptional regulator [Clostridia bacterium]|nr:LysR family transcriptional regulator [Clostridia bacterium]